MERSRIRCIQIRRRFGRKCQRSSQAIADDDNRFNEIESEIGTIKGELSALKMMVGIVIALNMTIILFSSVEGL